MNKEYIIKHFCPDDEDGIVKLLEIVFDRWPIFDLNCDPLDHWKWKYHDNPLKKILFSLCKSDEKIIGVAPVYSRRIKIGDEVLLCSFAGDLAVHPGFRGRGIFKKMLEENNKLKKEARIQYNYIKSDNPAVIKSRMRSKISHRFPFHLTYLVKIKDINLLLRMMPIEKKIFIKIGFYLVKLFNDLKRNIIPSKALNLNLSVSEVNKFDIRINQFWRDISEHYCFIVERNQDYLNWRYCDPRAGDLIVKQVEEDGRILGYSVLSINRYREEYPVGYIADLLTLPDRLDAANVLVADAIKYFEVHNINKVVCIIIKKHPYERILNRYGFLDSRETTYLFFDEFGTDNQLNKINKTSTNRIYFSYGDYDAI